MNDTFTPSPEDLSLLTHVVQRVARLHRLSTADAEDFAQSVQLRLVERNYDILRRFNGRSSLQTYLTVVVVRMLLDWRNVAYGKWRPSAGARRLGPHAVLLERLIYRDRFTPEEAIEIAATGPDAPPLSMLRQLANQLPPRLMRRMVGHEEGSVCAVAFPDPIEAAEESSAQQRARVHLVRVLRDLPEADRRLVYLRYARRRSVRDIASALQIDQRRLYRRFDTMLRHLRIQLVAAGVTRAIDVMTRRPDVAVSPYTG